jgi:hypothetical protein
MATEHDKLVYALATLKHIGEHAPAITPTKQETQKKHLTLLDHIALIMVTKAKGDVAAVRMEMTGQGTIFFYAKSSPCPDDFKSYLNNIVSIIANTEDQATMQWDILKEILVTCKEKLQNRIVKCQQELRNFEDMVIPKEHNSKGPRLSELLPSWAGKTPEGIITDFLETLSQFDVNTSSLSSQVGKSLELTHKACLIGPCPCKF